MTFGRNIVYLTFLALLVTTFALSHTNRVVAAEYAALPASAEETTPLRTGDRAPAFTVRTVEDEPFEFDPDNLERPVILISFRGGWCPYCNMHLSELRTDLLGQLFPQLILGLVAHPLVILLDYLVERVVVVHAQQMPALLLADEASFL